jgi:hypothetical protein
MGFRESVLRKGECLVFENTKISFKQECLQGKLCSLNMDETVQGAVGKKCLQFFISYISFVGEEPPHW